VPKEQSGNIEMIVYLREREAYCGGSLAKDCQWEQPLVYGWSFCSPGAPLQVARSWSLIWGRVVVGRPFLCMVCLYLCFSRVCVVGCFDGFFGPLYCVLFSQ